ncbi:MAG TPA: efflux RND transporter periplasmic adaptor subunit [Roseiarcus sp.]|nr:efflux RND transporter periplasmic adaptor subunit [Roseiarcus sp.]
MSKDQAEAHVQALAAPHTPTSAAQPDGSEVHVQPDRDQRKPVKAGRALLLLAVVAIALAYSGISGRHRDDEKLNQWTQERAVPPVAVVTLQRGGKTRELVLPGNVDAFYTASIHSQVMGYVQEWRKDIGAQVHQGDVLAVINTPELDERIAVAQSELAKAKANLALAKVTAARWDSLRHTAAVSQQEADEKDSDQHAQAAQVDAAASNVDRLKALKAFANIVAPFDGVVTARNVDVGSLVKAGENDGQPLFTVADIHQMRIYVPVPETYAAQLRDGMKATLELPEYPDRTFTATIATTSHAIDPKSRTLLVELLADNQDGLLAPGAFARIHFVLPPDAKAFRVPASAIMFRNNAAQVAIALDNRIVLKNVHILRDLGTEVEIAAGLGQDERIVINPPDSISDGEQVRVTQAAGESQKSAEEIAQTGREHGE